MSPTALASECTCRSQIGPESADLAVPGDPWTRLHYHFGQLLSAEEFRLEQNQIVLRRRLHHTALHGMGTVLGLKVRPSNEKEGIGRLIIEPGLALDSRGREILLPEDQCLDLRGLEAAAIWNEMKKIAGDAEGARIGYVVLRHQSCLARPAFSLEPACTPEEDLLEYGVIRDGFRADLVARPPPAEVAPWFTAFARLQVGEYGNDLRTRLVNHAINVTREQWTEFQSLWAEDKDAPLLLAKVRLILREGRVIAAPDPDNTVRAILPQVQALGGILAGADLVAGPATTRLYVERPVLTGAPGGPPRVKLSFSRPVRAATLKGAFSLRRLDATGWTALSATFNPAVGGLTAEVVADGTYADGMVFSVSLSGAGPAPLLGDDDQPLAGLPGAADPGPGIGADVHLILKGGV